ncbi:MAG TPA: hypothetical protein DEV93_15055 [Chloroflexi bacterium]|nr:hypothetical protein [Chloroflexota bacterium]
MGFEYREPYRTLYGKRLPRLVLEYGWTAVMPLGGIAEGLMLERLAAMIRSSERAVYEVGADNGNVWFELGISLGYRQPAAMMTGKEPRDLPDILRSAWLRPYADEDACLNEVGGFLRLANAAPLIPSSKVVPTWTSVVVIGDGERADVICRVLRESGRDAVEIGSRSIRSIREAVDLARSHGVVVAVRPPNEPWVGHESIAALVTLGAGFALRRTVVVAAGAHEFVPSDCIQLIARGDSDRELAQSVRALVDHARADAIPSGTSRPRITGALARPQRTQVAQTLRTVGRGLLDTEPGYGKTTLLDQVADELQWPTAWLTLEPSWSITQLLERLVAGVGEHAPSFGWTVLAELREIQRDATEDADRTTQRPFPSPAQIADRLVLDIGELSSPSDVLLVIDDLHNASEPSGQLLARFMQMGPKWLHIILAGRGVPTEVGRRSATGHLPTWRAEELRYSFEETTAYLREIVPELDAERCRLLHDRTEGWQAALAIIRLWLVTRPDAPMDQLREMSRGDRQRIYQVFATEYFAGLSSQDRQDLLAASLPSVLESEVARHLLGEGGALRIRELAAGPSFLTESSAGVYRFHALFREFLAQRWMEERGRDSLLRERSALAGWYQARGDSASAYQTACEAEDWDTAVAVLEPIIRGFANQGNAYFVLDLLSRLPEARIRRSRPLWESWVRALSHTGDGRALDEARRLAATTAPTAADQAIGELLFAELRHDRSELTDQELAEVCDQLSERLSANDSRLALDLRLRSVTVRAFRTADPDAWTVLHDEALALANAAESAGALSC